MHTISIPRCNGRYSFSTSAEHLSIRKGYRLWPGVLLALSLVCLSQAAAALEVQRLSEDKQHVRTWNAFAEAVYALHQRQLAGREVRTESHIGGYAGLPDYYKEVSYYDAHSGHLLSRIQWEQENPGQVHVIEVFVRDAKGRVIRDYTAGFLPFYRNAPNQTLISLHNYRGDLHAFRTFDASGDRIFERCEGTFAGKPVALMLDEDALIEAEDDADSILHSAVYRACFKGVAKTVESYLEPK